MVGKKLRDNEAFARWLKAEMKARRIDQPMLTEALKMAEGVVSRWCTGQRGPKYFGVDADFISALAGLRMPTKQASGQPEPVRDMIAAIQTVNWTPERIRLIRLILDDMLAADRAAQTPAP